MFKLYERLPANRYINTNVLEHTISDKQLPKLKLISDKSVIDIDNMISMKKRPPHSRANFLTDDGRIIVGAFPLDPNGLLNYGVDVIVNLVNDHYKLNNVIYLSYPIGQGRAPSIKIANEIVSKIIPFYNQGKVIYIHCSGGHGRAGTIAAMVIGKLLNLDGVDAIKYVELARENREDRSRNFIPTPETQAQVNAIIKFLGNPMNKQIPDRSDKSWIIKVKRERKMLNIK